MNVPIDVTGVELRTERMLLRPWRESDLEDFYEYASVEGVGEMAGWPHHTSIENSRMILSKFIEHKKTFALEYEGKVIGSLGVEAYDEAKLPSLAALHCRELGFVLSKAYWGRGLMPEAVRAVTQWLFEAENLDAVVCGHFDWNTQFASVQEKCGFREYTTGTYETNYGTLEKEVITILFRNAWETK